MNLYQVGAWNGERNDDYDCIEIIVIATTSEEAIEAAKTYVGWGWVEWKSETLAENVTWAGMPEIATVLNKKVIY
jgi:hypothetical protein